MICAILRVAFAQLTIHAAGEEGMAYTAGEHTFELEATNPVGTGFLLR